MVHAKHLNESIILNLNLVYEYGDMYKRVDIWVNIGNLAKTTELAS